MENNEKIIILSGGSRGIGHATSKKFWDDGWTVITKDGNLSAQWEHTVLVTKNGCEILTDRGD